MPYVEGQSLADICDERGRLPVDMAGKICCSWRLPCAPPTRSTSFIATSSPERHGDAERWDRVVRDSRGFRDLQVSDKQMAATSIRSRHSNIGTPGYSAAGAAPRRPVTAKADIYALGVLAYRIL